MTDEEYVERAAAMLKLEEEMLGEGKSQAEIDAFFYECRQYDFDVVSQQLLADGHSPEEIEQFWGELTRFYDTIETYDVTDDVGDDGDIGIEQLLVIIVLIILIVVLARGL